MIFLATVTHDIRSNTLEATWLEEVKDAGGNPVEYRRAKCRSYCAEQKGEFLGDTGEEGQKYVDMARW